MNTINFIKPIPPHKQLEINRWYTISLSTTIILIIVLTLVTAFQFYSIAKTKAEEKKLQSMLNKVNSLSEKSEQLKKNHQHFEQFNTKLNAYLHEPKNPAHYLKELSVTLPADIALTSYKQHKKTVEIEGLAAQTKSIMAFLGSLNQSKKFKDMQLKTMHQDLEKQNDSVNDSAFIRFVLKGTINW